MDAGAVIFIPLGLLAALLAGKALAASGLLPIPDEARRMGCLDGLRGYLALMVAVHHFVIWRGVMAGEGWHPPGAAILNNFGQTGVALFFMASGALFYAKVRRELLGTDWSALYISRLFRIVPLMWLATALVLAVVWMRGGTPQPGDGRALLKWLTFVKNPDLMGYPHTSSIIAHVVWSLRYEWMFYFGLPVLALLLALTRRWLPDWAVVAAGTALLLALPEGRVGPFGFVLIAFFGLGMIGYELAHAAPLRARLTGPAATVVALAAFVTQMTFWPTAFGPVQGLLLLAFFAPVLAGNSCLGLLSRSGSVALGEVSYGIYLLHGIVLSVWMLDLSPRFAVQGAGWAFLPPLMVAVTLLASATFLLLERPMIAVGRRLARRRPARRLDA